MEYEVLLIALVGIVIGALIVGVGTSMPEMTVSFIGAINGNAEVAIGNAVGPISSMYSESMIAAAALPLLLCHKGKINRAGGLTLFIMFVAYCWYLLSNQTAI